MKKFIPDPNDVWGENGLDIGGKDKLKWPIVLSTEEFDVYDTSFGNNSEYSIKNITGVTRYISDTIEGAIKLYNLYEREE